MTRDDMHVANTILAQLGGNRFIAMTGARNIVRYPTALSLRFGPGGKAGLNGLRVQLNANDYYDVSFFKLRGTTFKVIAKIDNVPVENLRETFTGVTGLETSLGTMGNPRDSAAEYRRELESLGADDDTPEYEERLRRSAVDDAIAASNRAGRRIGGKEASAIHRLLKGRHKNFSARNKLDVPAIMRMAFAFGQQQEQKKAEALGAKYTELYKEIAAAYANGYDDELRAEKGRHANPGALTGALRPVNFLVRIHMGKKHSLAVVHGARDKYHALRVVRDYGYKSVAHIPVREVSDEVAALAPYPIQAY